MTLYSIRLIGYRLLGLMVYSVTLTCCVLGANSIINYDIYLTKREDIRHVFITQSTPHTLIYTGFECTTSAQPHTPIPSIMASLGRGYRYAITANKHIGAYVFVDYGIDKHHTLHKQLNTLIQPIKRSSLAAAYLLRHISPPPTEVTCQETQFVNLNIGFEYWLSTVQSQLNFYFPLYSNSHRTSTHPFYIEDGYYGIDIQWVYRLNPTLMPFTGLYGFYQPNHPNMTGWTCGLTVSLPVQCVIDLKYSIDSLRGQAWSAVLQTQLNRWLKFYYKYTYDAEQGHTNALPNYKSLFFGLQWNFELIPQRDISIFPRHRHLSPVMLRVPVSH